MKMREIVLKIKNLFKKKQLPKDVILAERPSIFLVILVYLIGIIVIILVWKFYKNITPFVVKQITIFFKGVKKELIESVIVKAANFAYFLILILIMGYHLKREVNVFTLTKREIILKKGIFVRKEFYIPLAKIRNVSIRASLLGIAARYGTIELDTGGFMGVILIENVTRPREKARQILELMSPQAG